MVMTVAGGLCLAANPVRAQAPASSASTSIDAVVVAKPPAIDGVSPRMNGPWTMAFISAQSDPEGGDNSANYTVGRVQRDIFARSTVAVMGSNRRWNGADQGAFSADTSLFFSRTVSMTSRLRRICFCGCFCRPIRPSTGTTCRWCSCIGICRRSGRCNWRINAGPRRSASGLPRATRSSSRRQPSSETHHRGIHDAMNASTSPGSQVSGR
jgi:hypothetical protein